MKFLLALTIFFSSPAISFGEAFFPGPPPDGALLGQDLSRALELKGVIVALGPPGNGVAIHFGSMRVVSKKLHGLRIGLIPELEVQRMAWRVKSAGAEWSSEVREFFGRESLLASAEFNGFALVFEESKDFRLEAKKARFEDGARHLELRGVAMRSGGRRFYFPEARLLLEEPLAGYLEVTNRAADGLKVKLPSEMDFAPVKRAR
jgi:hypothetical protein